MDRCKRKEKVIKDNTRFLAQETKGGGTIHQYHRLMGGYCVGDCKKSKFQRDTPKLAVVFQEASSKYKQRYKVGSWICV